MLQSHIFQKVKLRLTKQQKKNIIHLFMKLDTLDIVKDIEKVGLDGVGVRGLAQDLQQGRIRDKEETRKQQTLLLQITVWPHNLKKNQYKVSSDRQYNKPDS